MLYIVKVRGAVLPCGREKPTYKTKKDAKRHGAITYGKGKYYVRKVKRGWKAYRK